MQIYIFTNMIKKENRDLDENLLLSLNIITSVMDIWYI